MQIPPLGEFLGGVSWGNFLGEFRSGLSLWIVELGESELQNSATIGEDLQSSGEVAERLNAADSKSVMGSNSSGVRIPPSPLSIFTGTVPVLILGEMTPKFTPKSGVTDPQV